MKFWDRIEEALAGLLGLVALAIGLWQVIGRYIDPDRAIGYAEEMIVYLVIWAIMFVSSQLVRHDGHVRSDLIPRYLAPQVRRWGEVLSCVAAVVFCAALAWYGWRIVDDAMLLDERSSTDLRFPMWLYYLSLPVGSGLMAARYAIRLVRFAFFFDPMTMTVGHGIAHEAPRDMVMAPPHGTAPRRP